MIILMIQLYMIFSMIVYIVLNRSWDLCSQFEVDKELQIIFRNNYLRFSIISLLSIFWVVTLPIMSYVSYRD